MTEAAAPGSLLSLSEISLSYGKRKILDAIDLEIAPGSFTVIAGESGSGKSTLLYILGGFLRPDRGIYLFEGKRVYGRFGEFGLGRFRKKYVGFLFQDFRLLPFLTVEQNIRFPALFSGKKLAKEQLQNQMQNLGIAHRSKAYPNTVSGGEAQRTALARALLMNPPLLLLDEPTGNLDSATEAAIVAELVRLKAQGLTLVCVSHSNFIMQHADRVLRLIDGKLHEQVAVTAKPVRRPRKKS
ncbi:ABC transporter ATP-binding protein [Turneriella parva]|uniref:ABC transporter related protein n=1 Tax=Turneriella parva (strain ATCC BAA-1111 / DSM 21527 / NCTC 11395 / H) TaxID=869212 RepID=I4B3V9_TURPD|nr:ATP-binding cassette domain-containing protein [Turneriella parva]AFM11966.1 ABC transporter related protein [Turneriella parva DSM 21527]